MASLALPLFPHSATFKPLLLSPAATSSEPSFSSSTPPTRRVASVSALAAMLPRSEALPALIAYGNQLLASDLPYDAIGAIASVLTGLCERNDARDSPVISKFHAASKPDITIKDYLLRVWQYAECSETCFVLALAYIDRAQQHPDLLINSLNIHRLLITSVMVAAKFFDDHYYNNAFYARIGGVTKEEMNQLELEFLFMISFSLALTVEEYYAYDFELRAHHFATLSNLPLPSHAPDLLPSPLSLSTTIADADTMCAIQCSPTLTIDESQDVTMCDSNSSVLAQALDLPASMVPEFTTAAAASWPTPAPAVAAAQPAMPFSLLSEWNAVCQPVTVPASQVAPLAPFANPFSAMSISTSFVFPQPAPSPPELASSSQHSQSHSSQSQFLATVAPPAGIVHRRDSPLAAGLQHDQLTKRLRADSFSPSSEPFPATSAGIGASGAFHVNANTNANAMALKHSLSLHAPPAHQLQLQSSAAGFGVPFSVSVGTSGVKINWQQSLNHLFARNFVQ